MRTMRFVSVLFLTLVFSSKSFCQEAKKTPDWGPGLISLFEDIKSEAEKTDVVFQGKISQSQPFPDKPLQEWQLVTFQVIDCYRGCERVKLGNGIYSLGQPIQMFVPNKFLKDLSQYCLVFVTLKSVPEPLRALLPTDIQSSYSDYMPVVTKVTTGEDILDVAMDKIFYGLTGFTR